MDKYIPFTELKKELFKDKEFKKAYDDLGPEFELIESLIRKRLEKKLTQGQLAKKLRTKQPVISRLEGGTANPSLKFLKRVAKALDGTLRVTIS